jgi:hypothetical protein
VTGGRRDGRQSCGQAQSGKAARGAQRRAQSMPSPLSM